MFLFSFPFRYLKIISKPKTRTPPWIKCWHFLCSAHDWLQSVKYFQTKSFVKEVEIKTRLTVCLDLSSLIALVRINSKIRPSLKIRFYCIFNVEIDFIRKYLEILSGLHLDPQFRVNIFVYFINFMCLISCRLTLGIILWVWRELTRI